MRLFFRGVMAIVLAVMSLGNIQQVNAQNIVVDDLKKPNEVVKAKYDTLMLDPNISIEKNYCKIGNLLYLHRGNDYSTYIIKVIGHYVGNHNNSYDFLIGTIRVKDKDKDNIVNRREQIEKVLTKLYSHSLDRKFQVNSEEYDSVKVDGGIFYYLYTDSPLYGKINFKVYCEIQSLKEKSDKLYSELWSLIVKKKHQ